MYCCVCHAKCIVVAYSKNFQVNASALDSPSPFLKQQQREVSELAKRSDLRSLELFQLVTQLHELLQQPYSFSMSMQAQRLCADLEAVQQKVVVGPRKPDNSTYCGHPNLPVGHQTLCSGIAPTYVAKQGRAKNVPTPRGCGTRGT